MTGPQHKENRGTVKELMAREMHRGAVLDRGFFARPHTRPARFCRLDCSGGIAPLGAGLFRAREPFTLGYALRYGEFELSELQAIGGETQMVSPGREHQQAVADIADLIGFGEVLLELRTPSGIFGVTIILS